MAMKAKEVVEVIPPKNIFVGNKNAPVTLMEFGEYENEDCAKANEVVKKLLEEFGDNLRFNFRHFPLTQIHQRSMKAGDVIALRDGEVIAFAPDFPTLQKEHRDLVYDYFARTLVPHPGRRQSRSRGLG